MIVLGLGSNLGDRLMYLRKAVAVMTQGKDAFVSKPKFSAVYESQALLPPGAPIGWDMAFYNMAMSGETKLSPEQLLDAVKDVERKLGREARGYWGPREIDVDILAYDDVTVDTPSLIIPQRELLRRDFALIPMSEVAPDWAYPADHSLKGKSAHELVKELGMSEHYALKKTPHKVK